MNKGRLKNYQNSNLSKAKEASWDQDCIVCHNCGKTGHMVKDCWQKGGGKEGQFPSKFKKRDNKGKGTNPSYQADKDRSFDVLYNVMTEDESLITYTTPA